MHRRSLLPSLLAVAGLVAPLPSAAENLRIEPGQWKIRVETKNSMMPKPRVDHRTECVSENEWDTDRLMRDARGCEVKDIESSAEKLSWRVECSGPGGSMTGKAVYHSKGDRVDGKMTMATNSGGMNVTMQMEFDGERVGDCTP